MAGSSSSGRLPQPEVIMDFADGGTYIKDKLESAVLQLEKRRLMKEEGTKAQRAMEALEVKPVIDSKSEDVDLAVSQIGCTKDQAETALRAENGDLVKALIRLITPQRTGSYANGTA
ncbi:hypothetical protein M231_00274 [Tremella mesenterica]|uniref:Nascent polypeptide-associated complex subunit alpha-like UBA domain-containing protein n=1 Tax=Tremella mesenterica TaxID=5217 RepID=A0A4Q1BVV4_TREME|nr:hypothetical protein M231_00274 [Tremella mesenterica]